MFEGIYQELTKDRRFRENKFIVSLSLFSIITMATLAGRALYLSEKALAQARYESHISDLINKMYEKEVIDRIKLQREKEMNNYRITPGSRGA